MEISREQPQPGLGERAARTAVVVFLLLAIVTLAFGLGWGLKDLNGDGGSGAAAPGNGAVANTDGGDSVGAAIIDEIVELLENQYVDKATLDAETLRSAAIQGIITALNDSHTQYLTPAELKAGALSLDSS